MEQMRKKTLSMLGPLLILLTTSHVQAYSIFGDEVENFLKEKVAFGGFIENTTGLAIGPDGDRRHFNTSNRFIMNRFVIQPEFNVDATDWAKFFISWRFVKEPRYEMEARSRRRSVSPAAAAQPLESTFYDEDSPKPWEAVLDLKPTDLLHIRLGRQFITWGETDGVRLLDVINSQDSTFAPAFAPNLFDLDETKIPSWGMRFLYTVIPVSNTIFEFVGLPGLDEKKQRVDDVLGSNDTADAQVRYGRWSSHPETRMPFGRMFTNGLAGRSTIIPVIRRKLPDAHDGWKIGAKISHNIGALNFGLGYILGYNPQGADMVFKLKSIAPGPPTTTIANMELINDRTSIFAGHFNYTVNELGGIPFNTAVRGEAAFYPSEPYNISKFPGSGFRAGPHPRHPSGVTEKDTLRYALGFDRSVLIPALQDDPWRAYRFSFQIIQRIIFDHENGIRFFSTAERIKTVSTFLTLRIDTGYFGDTILPNVFLAYNVDGYWSANPALTYAPSWNEKIRFTLTAALFGGQNKFAFPGLLAEKDSLFLKMRYQF